MTSNDTINLFFERPETDRFIKNDRHLKRLVRPYWERLRRKRTTGFAESFRLLVLALERTGHRVRINDRDHARANPHEPVGLVGFPVLIEGWDLPNPALIGPSLYDHPQVRPHLLDTLGFQKYVVLGDWHRRLFETEYGDACVPWFAAIDPTEWPDTTDRSKKLDFLIYDKVYRDRDLQSRYLIAPIEAELRRRGLTFETLRYEHHAQDDYRAALGRAKGMIFLCEHESQGIAYQEAMMSGVPILAWNFGILMDPIWKVFHTEPVAASSVPFFSDMCGETFGHARDFASSLDRFTERRSSYEPRRYMLENMSQEKSARLYVEAYRSVMR